MTTPYAHTFDWLWRVVFVNERMGFRRSYEVEAVFLDDALAQAWARLDEMLAGRPTRTNAREDFFPIEVVRVRAAR
jgi:hypothetical protein